MRIFCVYLLLLLPLLHSTATTENAQVTIPDLVTAPRSPEESSTPPPDQDAITSTPSSTPPPPNDLTSAGADTSRLKVTSEAMVAVTDVVEFTASQRNFSSSSNVTTELTTTMEWHTWTTTKIIVAVICLCFIVLALVMVTSGMVWILYLRRKKMIKDAHENAGSTVVHYKSGGGGNANNGNANNGYMKDKDEIIIEGLEFQNPLYASNRKLEEIAL